MRGPVLVARPAKLNQLAPALWRVLQHFWPYVRKRRLLMLGAFAALFVEVVMRILEPWPLKFIFDRIIPTQGADAAADGTLLETMTPGDVLVLSAIAVVIIAVVRAVASYVNVVGFALIGNRVLTEVRNDVYRHLQTLSLSFHGKSRTGDMIVRVIGDIGLLQDVTVTALLPLLGNLMVLAGMLGVVPEIGEVLNGDHPGRTSETEITLFRSLGLAVEDIASAQLVYERALARGIGTSVDLDS